MTLSAERSIGTVMGSTSGASSRKHRSLPSPAPIRKGMPWNDRSPSGGTRRDSIESRPALHNPVRSTGSYPATYVPPSSDEGAHATAEVEAAPRADSDVVVEPLHWTEHAPDRSRPPEAG